MAASPSTRKLTTKKQIKRKQPLKEHKRPASNQSATRHRRQASRAQLRRSDSVRSDCRSRRRKKSLTSVYLCDDDSSSDWSDEDSDVSDSSDDSDVYYEREVTLRWARPVARVLTQRHKTKRGRLKKPRSILKNIDDIIRIRKNTKIYKITVI